MKKIISGIGTILLLIFAMILFPKNVNAQSITPTNFLIKNSNNTAVLYQSSNRDYFTSTPYYSGKFEINLASASVEYNASYGLDMYLTMYVGAFSDYGNFGYDNPELYINYNGLHQTGYTLSSFTNSKGACSNVVCPYQLHLSFIFATQYQGTLYLALPYDIPYDTYGWTLNSLDITNYGSNTSNSDIIANNNQNTQNIIANNNSNFGNLINNQNTNTQSIINNQNNNTQQIIESNKVCTLIDGKKIKFEKKMLNSSGSLQDNNSRGVSDFIPISSTDTLKGVKLIQSSDNLPYRICFYDSTQSFISCIDTPPNIDISIPSTSSYVRFTFNNSNLYPSYSICGNGNQNLDNAINSLNDSINDKNIDNAMDNGSEFFDNFNHDSHGLSGIITSPIRLLNSLTTAQCTPLRFNLPFVHNEVTLACPRTMYESYFGVFFSLWQLITTGLITYNVCINIYHKIHMMQNPYSDRIEVLNL